MDALVNKVAIVTGASSGIGRAAAKLFAREGAKVVIGARREQELNLLAEEIRQEGGLVSVCAGDVRSELYAKTLVETAVQEFGSLNIAFNNAGKLGAPGATPDVALGTWENIISTNLTSAFLSAKYQLPAMVGATGFLIFTSSFAGYTVGMPQLAAYSASKAGIIGLVKSLASEYGASGIRVNALLPGGTDTPMAREFSDSPKTAEFVNSIHALKRIALPEEIAQSVLYLASDASSFTTGTAMLVDGGVSISKT